MLAVEIHRDGGVRIAGTEADLRALASWLLKAAVLGDAHPTFISDSAITTIDIERVRRAGT